ncbi:MAG: colanic acid biosynthesis acetyltransferase WcaF [Elusimicrobia bacterium]|nr:colanic acid biosynthesis acetyltransferase WcaF [Elusimicrobiota bacterium]
MNKVDLSKFNNSWYNHGSKFKCLFWYLCNIAFLKSSLPYPSWFKIMILKLFGAKISWKTVIKPCVNIKYPWFLEIGDNVWIGEDVWIDNLCLVKIGDNVCISQGVYILTGNHNYKTETFDLLLKPVVVEDGVWLGAKSIICPGIILKSHSILTVGSVLMSDTEEYTIYKGNPAVPVKKRIIK